MTESPLTKRALRYATERAEGFVRVQQHKSREDIMEATTTLLEGLGLSEALQMDLAAWLDDSLGPGWDGSVLFGLIIGLFIKQYNDDA